MQTIAVVSQKGGAGKSTLAISLGVEAQRKRKSALVIDVDKQGNSYRWAQRRERSTPRVVSSQTLMLNEYIDEARSKEYAMVIIDTAGNAGDDALACAKVADFVLVPTRANLFDVEAISTTIAMLDNLHKPYAVVVNALHPTALRKFAELKQILESRYQATVYPEYLSQRAVYADCILSAQAPQEFEDDKQGKATREIGKLYKYVVSK